MTFDLNSKEHIYILGYMWADCYFGYNKTNLNFSLELQSSDFINIWSILESTGYTNYKTRKRQNSKNEQSVVRTGKQKDLKILLEYGFLNKREKCKLYYSLSNELKPYFIKGFLDGDGSISVDKNNLFRVSFSGAYKQDWSFLEDYCNFLDIPFTIYNKSRKSHHASHTIETHYYSVFEFTKLQHRVDFCKSLEHIDVGLSRKLDVYNNYKRSRLELQKTSTFAQKLRF